MSVKGVVVSKCTMEYYSLHNSNYYYTLILWDKIKIFVFWYNLDGTGGCHAKQREPGETLGDLTHLRSIKRWNKGKDNNDPLNIDPEILRPTELSLKDIGIWKEGMVVAL